MFIVGLTGGIASGKSTVASMLKELGAVVINADEVARELVRPGQPAWYDLVAHFGPDILEEDGSLDRSKLAKIVFNDEKQLKILNDIVHPRVKGRFLEVIKEYRLANPQTVLVLDVPLLLEAGMDSMVDEVWVVAVDQETQLKRVMERDKLSRDMAQKRIKAQMPLADKLKRADRIINTGVSLQETRRQVENVWCLITRNKR